MSSARLLPLPRRFVVALVALGLVTGLPAAAADAPVTAKGDEELIRRLEASGAFDQAGDQGFFKFADAVLAATQSNGKGLAGGDSALNALAKAAGAGDDAALKTCLAAPAAVPRIQEDMQDGIRAGVEGTPGLILRDNASGRAQRVGGALSQEQMDQALRAFVEVKRGG